MQDGTNREHPRRGPGRPSQPIARDTLLSIARRAFAEHGYAGTSMRDVALGAGLTKASLFHHFPSKETLYMEALASILGDIGGLVAEAGKREGVLMERLLRLGDMAVDYLGAHPEAARLLTRELLGRGPFMESGGDAMAQATLTAISDLLEAGMEDGQIPRQDAKQLVMSAAGLHLYLFAAPEVASRYLGLDVFSEGHIEARKKAVARQIRALCGVPVVVSE